MVADVYHPADGEFVGQVHIGKAQNLTGRYV